MITLPTLVFIEHTSVFRYLAKSGQLQNQNLLPDDYQRKRLDYYISVYQQTQWGRYQSLSIVTCVVVLIIYQGRLSNLRQYINQMQEQLILFFVGVGIFMLQICTCFTNELLINKKGYKIYHTLLTLFTCFAIAAIAENIHIDLERVQNTPNRANLIYYCLIAICVVIIIQYAIYPFIFYVCCIIISKCISKCSQLEDVQAANFIEKRRETKVFIIVYLQLNCLGSLFLALYDSDVQHYGIILIGFVSWFPLLLFDSLIILAEERKMQLLQGWFTQNIRKFRYWWDEKEKPQCQEQGTMIESS